MAKKKITILLVDDEEQFLKSTGKRLELRDFEVIAVDRGDRAIAEAKDRAVDIALVDLKMPGLNGEQTMQALKDQNRFMEVVILTGHGSIESAVELTKGGAFNYLQKPCEWEKLLQVLTAAYKKKVMNKLGIGEARMNQMLKNAEAGSPSAVLRMLRELDE